LALLTGLAGCVAMEPFVEGEVRLAAESDANAGQFLIVRAVPDHPDGFDPRRVYHGDEEFIGRARADEIEFPHAFHLEGPEPRSQDIPWLLLAWLSDDPHATWIQPGQTFGASQFELVHHSHAPVFADGLEVALDGIAPPP
jgi:hypothetical protein